MLPLTLWNKKYNLSLLLWIHTKKPIPTLEASYLSCIAWQVPPRSSTRIDMLASLYIQFDLFNMFNTTSHLICKHELEKDWPALVLVFDLLYYHFNICWYQAIACFSGKLRFSTLHCTRMTKNHGKQGLFRATYRPTVTISWSQEARPVWYPTNINVLFLLGLRYKCLTRLEHNMQQNTVLLWVFACFPGKLNAQYIFYTIYAELSVLSNFLFCPSVVITATMMSPRTCVLGWGSHHTALLRAFLLRFHVHKEWKIQQKLQPSWARENGKWH